ncbi:MAG: hypothetical protein COT73_04990 [Bdellovibrio sp. CG10_big_fil_rev_8_21_14_0_10_47_8]|nr:MAG: hypothetical protein COT73_04990 [Bdellovibrio sp. CG10_big_fil_rev_8_21_14_0_10_47_8]
MKTHMKIQLIFILLVHILGFQLAHASEFSLASQVAVRVQKSMGCPESILCQPTANKNLFSCERLVPNEFANLDALETPTATLFKIEAQLQKDGAVHTLILDSTIVPLY